MRKLWVLRLGHRLVRDDRVSTHVGLVARAFGADGMYLVGGEPHIKDKLDDITKRWGGSFEVQLRDGWKDIINEWKGKGGYVVHLTMYGIHIEDILEELRGLDKDLLIIVGAEKVPKEVFKLSDFNVAIGHQPHSEVAALAVFLDRLFMGEELKREFPNFKLKVVPSPRGKKVEAKP